MTDKSAEALLQALTILGGTELDGDGIMDFNHSSWENVEMDTATFQHANDDASDLSIIFSGNNDELSKGWANVAQFTQEIFEMVKTNLSGVASAIQKFGTYTLADELNATQAADTAKSKADSILAELNSASNN